MDDKDVQLKLQNDLLASIHNSNIKFQIENDELKEKVNKLQQENQQLKERINEAVEILGEYKHYSTPTEEQNRENEDVVDKAYEILKGSDK